MDSGRTSSLDRSSGPVRNHSETDVECSWSCSLRDRDPKKSAAVFASVGLTYAAALYLLNNPLLALIPAALILSAVSEYLFPIRYTVSERGITARWAWNSLEMSWKDVKKIYDASDGVKFSPLGRSSSRFEAMRGILVRFDGEATRDQVLSAILRYREESFTDA